MEGRRSRADLVPNANNPRLLLRLLGFVATGVRRPAALAELLEVELRTVHYYTQAGEWLGLLRADGELRLSPRGLALVYADPDTQAALYAEAVWANPLAAEVLGTGDELPDLATTTAIVQARQPRLSPATARRRAGALRGLLQPALLHKPHRRTPRGDQLTLPFPRALAVDADASVDLRAGADESPDVYRRLLVALLDHGELSTGNIRALLDGMGAPAAALGAYVDMATRRADAVRVEERLVATAGATRRREVTEDSVLVALTDPLYREYLTLLDDAAAALQRTAAGKATPDDARLRARLTPLARRFASWDQRIFGRRLQPGEVDAAVGGLLVGRRLQGLPVAGDPGPEHPVTEGPFIDLLDVAGLPIALPRALVGLHGGVATVNRRLRTDREAPAGVRLPGPVDRRLRIHGGLIAAGENLPRAIPDNLSLRLRALTHVPALSLLGSLLLAGRRGAGRPVVRAGAEQDPLVVQLRGRSLGSVVELFGALCDDQGWRLIHPSCEGLGSAELGALAVDLGIAVRAAGRLLLEEKLFARLQDDPECRLVYDAMLPLEDRFMGLLTGP